MPVDKLALANLWKEIMGGVAASPDLMIQYDIGKIFAYTAQLAGAKNINRFKLQLTPDEVVAREAAKGNLIGVNNGAGTEQSSESFGTSGGTGPGGAEAEATRSVEPRQLSGVGPVS
jgi:hypothetical protein